MGGGAELGVRLNYSLALTRFVNSVVDSHQTGGFAQSIAAIAGRIGLPVWFVEIRHAVTHEELPSLAVCREAAQAGLSWLHRHFWVPQLFEGPQAPEQRGNGMDVDAPQASSSTTAAPAKESEEEAIRKKERRQALQDLRQTLKDYRVLAKAVYRDRSLANTSKDAFRKMYKQFAVFVSKIRVLEPEYASQLIEAKKSGRREEEVDVRTNVMLDPDEVDECTKSALSDLINQLIQPGGLVPMSKAKRVPASAMGDKVKLPAEVAAIWTPLLGHLRDTFGPIFGQLLVEELVDTILRGHDVTSPELDSSLQTAGEEERDDPSYQGWKSAVCAEASYRKTADAWLRFLVTTIPPPTQIHNSVRPAAALISDTELAQMCLSLRSEGLTDVLEFLCERNEELHRKFGPLVAVLKVGSFMGGAGEIEAPSSDGGSGFETGLEEMQKRLDEMNSVDWSTRAEAESRGSEEVSASNGKGKEVEMDGDRRMPEGWSWAPQEWKPTPFGCLNGAIPQLVLEI